jgi:hypothetical protein
MAVKTLELPNIPVDKNSLIFAREIDALPGVQDIQLYPDCYTKSKYLNLDYKKCKYVKLLNIYIWKLI